MADLEPLERRGEVEIDVGPIILLDSCDANPDTVTPSETVDIDYTMSNSGDEMALFGTFDFVVEGQVVATATEKDIAVGETRTGTVSFVPQEEGIGTGIYTVNIEGDNVQDCGPLTVESAQEAADIQLQSCTTSPSPGSTVNPDGAVEISATIRNSGGSDGIATVSFFVGPEVIGTDEIVGSSQVTLSPGDSRQLSATFRPANLGFSGENIETRVEMTEARSVAADGGLSRLTRGCSSCGH